MIIQIIPSDDTNIMMYGLDETGKIYALINTGSISKKYKWRPVIESPNYENICL